MVEKQQLRERKSCTHTQFEPYTCSNKNTNNEKKNRSQKNIDR